MSILHLVVTCLAPFRYTLFLTLSTFKRGLGYNLVSIGRKLRSRCSVCAVVEEWVTQMSFFFFDRETDEWVLNWKNWSKTKFPVHFLHTPRFLWNQIPYMKSNLHFNLLRYPIYLWCITSSCHGHNTSYVITSKLSLQCILRELITWSSTVPPDSNHTYYMTFLSSIEISRSIFFITFSVLENTFQKVEQQLVLQHYLVFVLANLSICGWWTSIEGSVRSCHINIIS